MKHVFAPWRNLGDYYKILIFGPRVNILSFFCFPCHAFNSHLLWWFIRLKRSHYRKEGNLRKIFSGREPQFLPHFLLTAKAQKGGRSADDNVCRSTGVGMRKGAGSRALGLLFSCGGAQCSGCSGGHSRAVLQGRDWLAAHLSTREQQPQVFRLLCLIPRVPHCQPGRKRARQACKASQIALHYSSGTEASGFCLVY